MACSDNNCVAADGHGVAEFVTVRTVIGQELDLLRRDEGSEEGESRSLYKGKLHGSHHIVEAQSVVQGAA